jgi:hypothetical protein
MNDERMTQLSLNMNQILLHWFVHFVLVEIVLSITIQRYQQNEYVL